MAGKKKKEKKKKKDTTGFSHIGSTLVPSSIFAAVPRTPTSLSNSWPRASVRTPSPLALAVGEAGNIGRAVLGNFSRPESRNEGDEEDDNETGVPLAYLTTKVGDKTTNGDHSTSDEEGMGYEDPGYASVETKDGGFDKATKFYRMSAQGRERQDSPKENRRETDPNGEGTSGANGTAFYHVLEKHNPPIYAEVDKSKKTSKSKKPLERDHGEEEVDDVSLSEYSSSDELTDVTSRHVATDDEDNSLSVMMDSKRPIEASAHVRRRSKKQSTSSEPTEEDTEGKLTNKKRKSVKKGKTEELDENAKDSNIGSWFRRKSKKKESPQVIPEEGTDRHSELAQPFNTPTDSVTNSRDNIEGSSTAGATFSAQHSEAMRGVERLGFEGVSKKLGLDDLSHDDGNYSPPAVPQNSIDFHGQTRFEKEQFHDTLLEDYTQALTEQEIAELNESETLNAEPVVLVDNELPVEGALRTPDTKELKKEHLHIKTAKESNESVEDVVRNSRWVESHAEPVLKPTSPGSVRARAALWNQTTSKILQSPQISKESKKGAKFNPVEGKGDELRIKNRVSIKQDQFSDQLATKAKDTVDSGFRSFRNDAESFKQSSDIKDVLRTSMPLGTSSSHERDIHNAIPRSLSKDNTSLSTSALFQNDEAQGFAESRYGEHHLLHAEPGFIPPFTSKHSRAFYHSEPSLYNQSVYREHDWHSDFSVTQDSLREQQKQIEILIQQQQQVFATQLEDKEFQQRQQRELIQQQQKLQDQLKLIEHLQRQHQLGSVSRSAETVTSDNEAVLQKELVQQQQDILQHQQEIQQQYQVQQERILKHQEKLYDQIMILEAQQKQIQSNIGRLSPREDDLEEIRQREQQIVDLLSEQRQQQQQYQELSKLQRQRLEEQAMFLEDRKSLEQQQEALRAKVSEQENVTRQLEQQLEEFRNEAANVAKNLSDKSVQAERSDKGQSSDRQEKENIFSRKSKKSDKGRAKSLTPDSESDILESRHHRHGDSKSKKSTSKKAVKGKKDTSDKKAKSRDSVELAEYLASGCLDVLESEKHAMLELNSSLQVENTALKQLVASLQKGGSGSSLVFQQQAKEQQKEIKVLRNTIHRLNVELSRFQAKYRPVTFEDVEGLSLPDSKDAAPWLINTKYLAPLFLAYDDRLKDKERLLKTYDEELNAFRARVMEVVKENQQLHLSQSKGTPSNLDTDEWKQLQEQAKLVVEENAVLMDHQSLQDRKMKELQRSHAHEVSKLSKKLSVLESEKRRLDAELVDLTRAHASLGRKHDALLKDIESRIPLTEHMSIVEECKRLLENVKDKAEVDKDDNNAMIEAVKKEKQSLATKLTDCEAKNAQLVRESEAYSKTLKKTERKVLFLQRQLEAVRHREKIAQDTLSEVLKVAEKTAAERDGMVELAKSQNLEQRKAATIIKKGDQSIRGLEEKLAEYKSKASQKVASVNTKLREKEKEINRLKEHYEKELNSLRELIRDKQHQLEQVIGQSRRVDDTLDVIWKEAAVDNKRMRNTIRGRGGAMFDSDSDPNHHLSSDEADK